MVEVAKLEVVGEEDQFLMVLLIPDHDAAEEQIFFFPSMLEE